MWPSEDRERLQTDRSLRTSEERLVGAVGAFLCAFYSSWIKSKSFFFFFF